MRNMFFGANFRFDDYLLKARRGEAETKQVKAVLDKELPVLDGVDADVTYRFQSAVDFSIHDRDIIEATYKNAKGEYKRDMHQRVHGNVVAAPFTALIAGLTALAAPFSDSAKEISKLSWESTRFRTEPLQKFVARVFRQIKADVEAAKADK